MQLLQAPNRQVKVLSRLAIIHERDHSSSKSLNDIFHHKRMPTRPIQKHVHIGMIKLIFHSIYCIFIVLCGTAPQSINKDA